MYLLVNSFNIETYEPYDRLDKNTLYHTIPTIFK